MQMRLFEVCHREIDPRVELVSIKPGHVTEFGFMEEENTTTFFLKKYCICIFKSFK